jgi:hypothetical protein
MNDRKSTIKKQEKDFTIVNKYIQEKITELTDETTTLKKSFEELDVQIDDILKSDFKLSSIACKDIEDEIKNTNDNKIHGKRNVVKKEWDDLVKDSSEYLEDKKIRIEELSHYDFLSNNELNEIFLNLNSPIYERISWDKWDYIFGFGAGILGGLIDIFLGKPGGYKEPKIKNDSYLGLGKHLKKYDLKNNPIDAHIPGASAGDHRLYSYGHDLFRFIKGLQLIMGKTDEIGIAGTGGIISGKFDNFTSPEKLWEAVLILVIHLYKDFWTARSLPIPGTTLIAELNGDKMPEFIHNLTNNKEFNLRQLSGQALSITVIEIIIRVYSYFRYKNSDYKTIQVKQKKRKCSYYLIQLPYYSMQAK